MRKHLLTVLDYFGYFSYAPSFGEIYVFFPRRISKKSLQVLLIREEKSGIILRLPNDRHFRAFQDISSHYSLATNHSCYTLPQYSIHTSPRPPGTGKVKSKMVTGTIQTYIRILKWCPFVRFVGVTGASAMIGPRKDDDLDLCIVTKHSLLWTTRFFVVVLAKILGIHSKTGVCLNLFFDESDLGIPFKKQNSYIAHELLQMKPIIDENRVYQQFLKQNNWIYRFFPNAWHVTPAKAGVQPINFNSKKVIIDWIPAFAGMTQTIDYLFKSIQLPIIHRNHAALFITYSQLWLFKNDFEKKLKRAGLVI